MNKQFTALFTAAVVLVLSIAVISAQSASAQVSAQGYFTTGRTTSTVGGVVTKTIKMNEADQIALILQASGGNFGSKFWIIQVSADNSNFITVDNVSLSTNTVMIKQYNATKGATTMKVLPTLFPYLKTFVSAGNSGVTETLTWSGVRD